MSRIAVIGLPYFAERVTASLRGAGLDVRYVPRDLRSPRGLARAAWELSRARLVYGIGLSAERGGPADLLMRLGKRVVLHWVGTDAVAALEARRAGRLSARVLTGATHWTNAPWLRDEVAPLGIIPEQLLLPIPFVMGEPLPAPPVFRVLLYLPERGHPAYDAESTLAVVRALPGVPFTVVGGWEPPEPTANLEVKGRVDDMAAMYGDHAVFLRLMHHDGMSGSVLEALSMGRHVVWSYPHPGVLHVHSADEAISMIESLRARHEAGILRENMEGARFVHEHYATERLIGQVMQRLQALAG